MLLAAMLACCASEHSCLIDGKFHNILSVKGAFKWVESLNVMKIS